MCFYLLFQTPLESLPWCNLLCYLPLPVFLFHIFLVGGRLEARTQGLHARFLLAQLVHTLNHQQSSIDAMFLVFFQEL